MEQIVSSKNRIIKEIKKLSSSKRREQLGVMMLEGVRLVETALAARVAFDYVLINQGIVNNGRGRGLIQSLQRQRVPIYQVSDGILKEICETDSPQGICAVVKGPNKNLEEIFNVENPFIVIADQIRDPGNLGTIIRTADAAGCSGVVCTKGTVSPTNSKVIRSTMGSIFHLPVVTVETLGDLIFELQKRNVQVIAADIEGNTDYYQLNMKKPTAIILGNEGEGIAPEYLQQVDKIVTIPIAGQAESLNAAIAGSILLYEVVRQRRGE